MAESIQKSGYGKWLGLGAFLTLAFAIAWAGSAVTLPKIPTWYAALQKPWFNPPSWIFGPAWTLLYMLMSVAAWRVWMRGPSSGRSAALFWYFGQLVLNAMWSPVFFGLQNPRLALAVIVALLGSIVVTAMRFLTVDRLAAMLLVPYLLWVAFATVLNASIVALN